jgi:hypothetical protein
LYRTHELAFRTQYAELKERTLSAGELLPGTPGSLRLREGTGHAYWYRVFYPVPGKTEEKFICNETDADKLESIRQQIAYHEWAAKQVSNLRKLGFQVADKSVARVMVELHNRHAFEAGLVLVGTLAFMSWLNELGGMAVAARTQDVDIARNKRLKFAAPLPFLETIKATGLPFVPVPGMPSHTPSTSVKLPGVQGLRVDVLTPGDVLGAIVTVPELEWCAQAVPFYDYLLEDPEPAAILAGGHCIPVKLPQAARFVWHKLYASTQRRGFKEKAEKDRQQALVLGGLIADHEAHLLTDAWQAVPAAMAEAIRPIFDKLVAAAEDHPELQDVFRECNGY